MYWYITPAKTLWIFQIGVLACSEFHIDLFCIYLSFRVKAKLWAVCPQNCNQSSHRCGVDEGIWFSYGHNNRLVCGRLFGGGQISSILISGNFLITLAAQNSWKPDFYSMLDVSYGICSTCTKALYFAFSQVIYIIHTHIHISKPLPFPVLSSPLHLRGIDIVM